MTGMLSPPASPPAGFSRRALLAGTAGVVLLAAGCTATGTGGPPRVGPEQADQLERQVDVQERVVAAYAAAAAADPALGEDVEVLAGQAQEQLERLRTAAPTVGSSATAPPSLPPPGTDVRGWLHGQVSGAAAAHEAACADQAGGRAVLLGSIAAGLRGHEAVLA